MAGRKILLMVACCVFSLAAFANAPAKKESIEKLLELTESSKMVDTIYAQIEGMSTNIATQMGLTEKDRPAFEKYMKKVSAIIHEDMSWAKMKEPMIEVYAKHFTEQEVQGLITFTALISAALQLKKCRW